MNSIRLVSEAISHLKRGASSNAYRRFRDLEHVVPKEARWHVRCAKLYSLKGVGLPVSHIHNQTALSSARMALIAIRRSQ